MFKNVDVTQKIAKYVAMLHVPVQCCFFCQQIATEVAL